LPAPGLRRSLGAWWDPLPPEASERAFDERAIDVYGPVFDEVALPSETPLITAARAAGVDVLPGSR
jgi:shikimate dehydrogenase